jgi:hypothetical protein
MSSANYFLSKLLKNGRIVNYNPTINWILNVRNCYNYNFYNKTRVIKPDWVTLDKLSRGACINYPT